MTLCTRKLVGGCSTPSFTPSRVLFGSVPHLIRQLLLDLLRYSLRWSALPIPSTIRCFVLRICSSVFRNLCLSPVRGSDLLRTRTWPFWTEPIVRFWVLEYPLKNRTKPNLTIPKQDTMGKGWLDTLQPATQGFSVLGTRSTHSISQQ